MKTGWTVCLWVAVLVMSVSSVAHADLFEDSLAALTNDTWRPPASTVSDRRCEAAWRQAIRPFRPARFRGFTTSAYPRPAAPSPSGDGLIDNLAGLLDPSQLESLVGGLQNSVQNLLGAVISSLPMVTACYAAPTLCDVTKHIQDLVNQVFQFKGLSCQQAETLLAGVGAKLSGARTSRCLSAQQRMGKTLAAAEMACSHRLGGRASSTLPPAARRARRRLIGRLAGPRQRRAGHQEVRQGHAGRGGAEKRAARRTSPWTWTSPPRPGACTTCTRPSAASCRPRWTTRCRSSRRAGNTLTSAKHQEVSLPGLALPHGVLQGLHDIREVDPNAYAHYREQLAGTFTMLGLSWRVNELRDLLEEGMLDNTELSEAEGRHHPGAVDTPGAGARPLHQREGAGRAPRPAHPAGHPGGRETAAERRRAASWSPPGSITATPDNQFGAQHPMGYGY